MDKIALTADRVVQEFYDSNMKFIGKMPDIVWEAVPVALAAYREEVNHLRHIIEQQDQENSLLRSRLSALGSELLP